MTATEKWTVNKIKDSLREAGSHWFDPDTMRFFGTRVLGMVYQGPGGIYFVTSEQPPHGPRGYTVRKFTPPDDIDTVGELCGYKTGGAASSAARGLAGAEAETTQEIFKPVSIIEQLLADLAKHGKPKKPLDTARAKCLIALAREHHHLMELLCSDEAFCKEVDEEGDHPAITENRDAIREVAERAGAMGVIFSGDPRGCTVKLTFEDGFTNDLGHEGYCVPTSLKDGDQ
jgi:hypothetical protein